MARAFSSSNSRRSHRESDDPFYHFVAPPLDETQEQAEARIRAERIALKISEDIDRDIRVEMLTARRQKCVKILLLGQSESGKSTVLKNFQRKYDPLSFDRERVAWRSVCQLNVVRSFGIIVDVLNHALDEQDRPHAASPLTPPVSPTSPARAHRARAASTTGDTDADDEDDRSPPGSAPASRSKASSTSSTRQSQKRPPPRLTAEHRRLIMRLAPLRQIEHALTRRFKYGPGGPVGLGLRVGVDGDGAWGGAPLSPPRSPPLSPRGAQEPHVSGYVWQRTRERRHGAGNGNGEEKGDPLQKAYYAASGDMDDEEDEGLTRVLCACREDMVALWRDSVVRRFLKVHRVGMEELSCFFLDNLSRIAVPHYEPTDDDILRARLKTLGVTEHRFTVRQKRLDAEPLNAADVRIYDVGGSRCQRQSWMPYFDDVNAIVFLAPMSAFDQTLVEAPEVNRLEDSFILWKAVCASKLLVDVSLVLLLNKQDVLERKLTAGVRFGRYVKSYQGVNQWEQVAKYLKTKFKAVQRELSPVPRLFYAHITCATDTKQMAVILGAIEDLVLRRNLEEINLL